MFNGELWINELSGKMEGMKSVSTSCICNEYCRERAKNTKLICNKCYAESTINRYSALAKHLIENTELLTESEIDYNALPYFLDIVIRFESFGDLQNETQVINYFNICGKNPQTTFTLWTKNPWFIKNVISKGYNKPENLIIGYSSPRINDCKESILERYDFIDFIFTVYTAEYAIEHNIAINCGIAKCKNCMRCYRKHNGVFKVNEILKQESKKYYKMLAKKQGTL